MASFYSTPATKYNFNSVQDIDSHSASLFNQRMALLFFQLDIKSVSMNTNQNIGAMLEVKAILKQLYKNIRYLVSNNPTIRATLKLDTREEGIYITDIALGLIDQMIDYCNNNGYTYKKLNIIVYELNNVEVLIKNILQYYHYFMRPNFAQKPDVNIAVEKYKNFADERTVDELKEIIGRNHHIDFESLGLDKIQLAPLPGEDDEKISHGNYKDVKDDAYYEGDR